MNSQKNKDGQKNKDLETSDGSTCSIATAIHMGTNAWQQRWWEYLHLSPLQ